MKADPAPPSPWRALWLALYYAAILAAVIALQSKASFATPKFIYQGF